MTVKGSSIFTPAVKKGDVQTHSRDRSPVGSTIEKAHGHGQPLDGGVRHRMESMFGVEFGSVRIHANAKADSLSRSLDAVALTKGDDIFFTEGAYNPHTRAGLELLGHELTHVTQQRMASSPSGLRVASPSDQSENEAAEIGRNVAAVYEHSPQRGAYRAQVSYRPELVANVQRQSTASASPAAKNEPETITFSEKDALVIDRPGHRSSVISTFYGGNFGNKLLAIESAFSDGLTNFSDAMRFSPDNKAKPDFQHVFLDQLKDLVKKGYEKFLEPALTEELPGIGTALGLVTAIHEEVEKAEQVAGELAIRDFLASTRTTFGDAIRRQLDDFIAKAASAEDQAQTAWQSAPTVGERDAITGPMKKLLARPTPSSGDFQKNVLSAYIRSQQGESDSGLLEVRILGRIQVKYDGKKRFESATVQLQTGSGSAQVAAQVNRLYGSPIDLRKLNVQISVGTFGPGVAGGETYSYVILNPPSFSPISPLPQGLEGYKSLPGDPLTVPEVDG